ncbi:hypothetical protein Halru_0653 [Halovivax ruber XH-70]|uniref:Uncharacterized protein n=1 Tax=Halovivax ruber (strain DSM 18193 / JCM 13892 / XH-70) TaxID=797302 RepID=L0I6Y2_HALRX|nr:hypothetical protein [Halovivax ruber]AGB15280.1 hypothetical protein Halru_0653 [Halovivax ruber XH-70]
MGLSGNPSRRGLLVAGVTATVGLAGCIGGPEPFTSLEVDVSAPFASEPPVSVPLRVTVHVQNVDSPDVALRTVELVAYDADLTELAAEPLGDFDWAGADEANRTRDERGGQFVSTTVYSADWDVETSLAVDAVPEWVTVRVGAVWFGDEPADEASAPAGIVSASTPPPLFSAHVARYAGSRPPPETVEPGDFTRDRVETGRDVEEPVLPPASAGATNGSASDG